MKTGQQDAQSQVAASRPASNHAGNRPGKKQLREALQAVYAMGPSEELLHPSANVDASADLLVAASSIPDPELRQLFQEVQQFCAHKRIGNSDDPARLEAAYKRASQRLEHLPAAPVETAGGGVMMAPLPGPRGVLGYDIDARGRVRESAARRMGRYLAMSPHAHRILRQMAELEQVRPKVAAGLEDDPELVRLWRKMGGPRHRHHNLHASDRQANIPPPPDPFQKRRYPAAPHHARGRASTDSLMTKSPPPIRTTINAAASMQQQERKGVRHEGQDRYLTGQAESSPSSPTSPVLSPSTMNQAQNFVSFGSYKSNRSFSKNSSLGNSPVNRAALLTSPDLAIKPSLKANLNFRLLMKKRKTPEELRANIVDMVEDLYRPLTTVAGQATAELDGSAAEQAGVSRAGSVAGDGPMYEPSDDEPDPIFAALLPKSPDASSDSYDSTPPLSPSSRPSSAGKARRLSRASCSKKSVRSSRSSCTSGEYTAEELLGNGSVRRRRSSGFKAYADGSKQGMADKFRLERRRSCGRHIFGGSTHRDSSGPSASSSSSADEKECKADDAGAARRLLLPAAGAETERLPGSARALKPHNIFSGGADADDEDAALEFLVATVLSLRRRQQIIHDMNSCPSSSPTSRQGSRAGSVRRSLDYELASGQQALREVTAEMRRLMADRRHSMKEHGIEDLELQVDQDSKAFQLVSAYADRWSVENDTAGMQDLAARLKQVLLAGRAPEPAEAQGITLAAVGRRLQQAQTTHSPVLDLALGCHKLNRADVEIVNSALQQARSQAMPTAITALKAGGGVLGMEGVGGLVQVLLRDCPQLEELDLSGCQYFGSWAAEKLGALLAPALGGLCLRRLDLSGCPIQDAGCQGLAKGLEASPHLTHLWLSKCDITDAGLKVLGDVVGQDTPLVLLDLSQNTFTSTGMKAFAEGMQANTQLRELFFQDCSLPDAAAPALATIITAALQLQLLDASRNLLGAAGAATLALGLQSLEPNADALLQAATVAASADQRQRASSAASHARSVHASEAGGRMAGHGEGPGTQRVQACLRHELMSDWAPSRLHTLLLSHNPLGSDGVILLLKALVQLQGPAAPWGCCLTVLGLDGVACARESHLTRRQDRTRRTGLLGPAPSAAARALQKLRNPEQEREERELQEHKRLAMEQHRQQEEEAERRRQQQQQQQQQHTADSLLKHQEQQQLQQEIAEQNLPPALRQEVEKEGNRESRGAPKGATAAPILPAERRKSAGGEAPSDPTGGQVAKKRVKKGTNGAVKANAPPPPPPPPPYFDPLLPNGMYHLDLGLEEHRKVAQALVDLYIETSGLAWVSAWLDEQLIPPASRGGPKAQEAPAAGAPMADRQPGPAWPSGTMPTEGLLKVYVLRVASLGPPLLPPNAGSSTLSGSQPVGQPLPRTSSQSNPGGPSSTPRPDAAKGATAPAQPAAAASGGCARRPELSEMSDVLETCLSSALQSPHADDVWRLSAIERLTNVACISAERAARLLACFTYSSQQVEAALLLLSVCTDVHALLPALLEVPSPPLSYASQLTHSTSHAMEGAPYPLSATSRPGSRVQPRIGGLPNAVLQHEHHHHHHQQQQQQQQQQRVPVMSIPTAAAFVSKVARKAMELAPGSLPPGCQALNLCNGTYTLNLGLQSHLFLASLLVALAASQDPRPLLVPQLLRWSACMPATPLGTDPSACRTCPRNAAWAIIGVNDARASIRHVTYNGLALLPPYCLGYLGAHELPAQGVLQLSFMAPITAARVTPLAAKKVSSADSRAAAADRQRCSSRQARDRLPGLKAAAANGSWPLRAEGHTDTAAQALTVAAGAGAAAGGDKPPLLAGAKLGWLGSGAASRAVLQQQQQQQQGGGAGLPAGPQDNPCGPFAVDAPARPSTSSTLPAAQQQQQQQQQQLVQGNLRSAEDSAGQLVALWEHLCMSRVDYGAINTICREVERGQHTNYDGWMGCKQEAGQHALSSKPGMSGLLSRAPSARSPGNSRQPSDVASSAEAATAATKGAEGGEAGEEKGLGQSASGSLSRRTLYVGSEGPGGGYRSGAQSAHPKPSLGSSALTGRSLAFVQFRVAAGAAWAACFARCVSQLGLDGDLGLASLKREACRIWNATSYEAHSTKLVLDGEARRLAYIKLWQHKQLQLRQEQQQAAGDVNKGTEKDGKDGRGNGDASAKKGSKKDKGSKSRPDNPKGKTDGKPKSAKELAAAEAHAKSVEGLLDASCGRATACLEDIAAHAAAFPVTVLQAAALLQLLPDVAQRLTALKLLLPAIVDTAHTLDLVACLDAPALLPPLPPPPAPSPKGKSKGKQQEATKAPSLVKTRDFGGDSFKHVLAGFAPKQERTLVLLTKSEPRNRSLLLKPSLGATIQDPSGHSATKRPISATGAFKMSPLDRSLLGMANTITSAGTLLSLDSSEVASMVDASLLHEVHQEHLGHMLLLAHMHATAAHVGWRWLGLPQSCMEHMQGDVLVVLDAVGEVEQLQALIRLCRLADRCREVPLTDGPGLQEAATDSGVLVLEHEGAWSYWEQVLGWACWRPWAVPEAPPTRASRPKAKSTKPPPPGARAPAAQANGPPSGPGRPRQPAGPLAPRLGKVALRFRLSQAHQEWAAATLIQAVWRGWAVRQLLQAQMKYRFLPYPQYRKELEEARRRVCWKHGELWQDDFAHGCSSTKTQIKRRQSLRNKHPGSVSKKLANAIKKMSTSVRRASTGYGFLEAMEKRARQLEGENGPQPGLDAHSEEETRSSGGSDEDTILPRGVRLTDPEFDQSGSGTLDAHQPAWDQGSAVSNEGFDSGVPTLDLGELRTKKARLATNVHALQRLASEQRQRALEAAAIAAARASKAGSTGGVEEEEEQAFATQSMDEDGVTTRTQAPVLSSRQEAAMLARAEAAKVHAIVAASAMCLRAQGAKVPQDVVGKWQYMWAATKVRRREQRLQLLARRLCVSFAQAEMQANADHLFPWPPPAEQTGTS